MFKCGIGTDMNAVSPKRNCKRAIRTAFIKYVPKAVVCCTTVVDASVVGVGAVVVFGASVVVVCGIVVAISVVVTTVVVTVVGTIN